MGWHRTVVEQLPQRRPGLAERVAAIRVSVEQLLHAMSELVRVNKRPVSVGGEREAVGDLDAVFVERSDHFSERRVLAADAGKVGGSEV
jgi:hypothetical protein